MISVNKLLLHTDFNQKLDEYSSTMALPWQHWMPQKTFVFRMEAYKLILKVKRCHVPNAYRFSILGRKLSLWVDSTPGPLRVKEETTRTPMYGSPPSPSKN